MDRERLQKQLNFIVEVDKMKTILRQSVIIDKSKRENDAEHSWHLALMAMILSEYAYSPKVDINRAIRMAIVHDLVEVYAGDTFAYDEKANEDKLEREEASAVKLFGILPEDQGKEMYLLWKEFDTMETPDSIYAAALDRLQPFILNYNTQGHTWALSDVTSSKIYQRLAKVKEGLPELWEVVEYMIQDSIDKGYIKG